ncbi:MAG: TetR/AcrR family transcriptional regulator [Actinobacteria bacterium]|nr:TetR/AcrR family transcriptional regulator [Actinomycetota bacterium]
MTSAAERARQEGRPRSAQADAAITRAVVDVFAERGYAGLTVEAVAERAGVARTTVYRRFPAKSDLLFHAVEACKPAPVAAVDTGSTVGDLVAIAAAMRDGMRSPDMGRVVPAVLAATARHPELAKDFRRWMKGNRRVLPAVIERGIERGELAPGTDVQLMADMVGGALFFRIFVAGGDVSDSTLAELAKRVVAGFAR